MALKKEIADKIKSYGFDVDKLIAAIKDEAEVDYELPDVVVMKPADLEARDANVGKERFKAGKEEGEKEAKATFIKEASKKLGIDFKGDRIADLLKEIEAHKNASNDDKVKELSERVNLLQKDKETLAAQYEQEQKRSKEAMFDRELVTFFPVNRTGDLSDAERLQLVKMNLSFEEMDGKTVVKRNGQVLRDPNTQNPLPINQVVTDLFNEKKWIGSTANTPPPTGGRGAGDNPPPNNPASGITTFGKFVDHWKEKNPGKGTANDEFTSALNKHAKETPGFKMYE
jgi:uncharacterized small protein (DUF1192 family)